MKVLRIDCIIDFLAVAYIKTSLNTESKLKMRTK